MPLGQLPTFNPGKGSASRLSFSLGSTFSAAESEEACEVRRRRSNTEPSEPTTSMSGARDREMETEDAMKGERPESAHSIERGILINIDASLGNLK